MQLNAQNVRFMPLTIFNEINFTSTFYRAMHFSAKRSIAIACRLSVRLSVCDVDGLWSHRLEYIRNNFTISKPGMFALCRPKYHGSIQGEHPKFGPKVTHPPCWFERRGDIRSQIPAEWLQIAQRSQWRAYRKLPSLFLMVPSLTPYALPFTHKMGVPYAPKIREWPYLCNGWSDPFYV